MQDRALLSGLRVQVGPIGAQQELWIIDRTPIQYVLQTADVQLVLHGFI